MHLLPLFTLALLLGAPRLAEPTAPERMQRAVPPTDSVWVFTNRLRLNGEWQSSRGPWRHLVRSYHVAPIRTDPVPYEVRLTVRAVHEQALTQSGMLHALHTELANGHGAMVLHVHGYATSLDEATEEAAEMRQRGGFSGPMAVFSWPARSLGMTWPAPGRMLSNAYWQDAQTAASSADDLAHLLLTLVGTLGADRVVVSAHSMGNQLLARALEHPDLRVVLSHTPLRAIVFASPDVDRDRFRDTVVPLAQPLAQRRLLYGARDDHMLRMSSIVHDGQARAGLLDPKYAWPSTLEVVDMTDGRVAAPWFGSWFDTNHALRRHGTALANLFTIAVGSAAATLR